MATRMKEILKMKEISKMKEILKMKEISKKRLELITAMITVKKGLITKMGMTKMKRKTQINPRRGIMIFTMI